jgi:hypothetical protein
MRGNSTSEIRGEYLPAASVPAPACISVSVSGPCTPWKSVDAGLKRWLELPNDITTDYGVVAVCAIPSHHCIVIMSGNDAFLFDRDQLTYHKLPTPPTVRMGAAAAWSDVCGERRIQS